MTGCLLSCYSAFSLIMRPQCGHTIVGSCSNNSPTLIFSASAIRSRYSADNRFLLIACDSDEGLMPNLRAKSACVIPRSRHSSFIRIRNDS